MRRFSESYLTRTRDGMWADSREALTPLSLGDRGRVLDVGCGTGELTRVLVDDSGATVVGVDRDAAHLSTTRVFAPVVTADARFLPFRDDSFDLVVCQALLINLADPAVVVREFDRVSSDLVAAVEPDNGAVTVESTVSAEAPLSRRVRNLYLDGVETDVTLGGAGTRAVFERVGLTDVSTSQYNHTRVIEPPYDETAVADAKGKATGVGLDRTSGTLLAGDLTAEAYDDVRTKWREMGRSVVEQMLSAEYRRSETVPFYVTVGRV